MIPRNLHRMDPLGGLLLLTLVTSVLAGCGGADTDQSTVPVSDTGDAAGSPTTTATVTITLTDTVETPEIMVTTTAVEAPAASGVSQAGDEVAAMADAFQQIQEQVDFELAVPTDLQGLDLVTDAPGSGTGSNPGISGPPSPPTVNATFGAVRDGVPTMVSLIQSAGDLGGSSLEGEVETVTVHGIEARLEREERDSDGPAFNLRWQMDGMHYHLGSSGLEKETILAFAESITPLAELQAMSEYSPLTTWSISEFEEAARQKGVEAAYHQAASGPGKLDIAGDCVLLVHDGGGKTLPVWPEPTSWNPSTRMIEFVSPLEGTEYERAVLQDGDRITLGGSSLIGDERNMVDDFQYWLSEPTPACKAQADDVFLVSEIGME